MTRTLKRIKNNSAVSKAVSLIIISAVLIQVFLPLSGCGKKDDDTIILRVSNWEEYMDQGGWDEEDAIELDDMVICPQNSLVEDFEEWFYNTYGKKVKVEYSTFGTNEELYNQITIGDEYDLVCPSEYMIMKMMTEDMLEPYSESFFDENTEENYYAKGVSEYIKGIYDDLSIDGESIGKYAAGYMWGTLGIVYNPDTVTKEEASCWDILLNKKFYKQITIKDSVRDAYFAANSIYNLETITDDDFLADASYAQKLSDIINSTDKETVDNVEEILCRIKENVYSFETDSGKSDLVTGKVAANQQWSGDAVYTMDQAEEDGVILCYATPNEATNLWFDGWCMLKDGIDGDEDKKMAAEAFVNFLSMPENAVRNMMYIGYTSVISGGNDDTVFNYADWCYGADMDEYDEDELMEYDISYFFGEDSVITTTKEQADRQLSAQYPQKEVTQRSVVMAYFDKAGNERINRMWTNVRCFDIKQWFEDLF
jgi:spermidine/putrescine transport system substrate-binding protein